jgi:N-acetylglucosamine-6-phosphate deacetylase
MRQAERSGGERALEGAILTPDGWVAGAVSFDARILGVRGARVAAPPAGAPVILPGFIDLHVHGGGGADVMDGRDAVETIARLHARYGTTSLLATTLTAPRADLERVLGDAGRRLRARVPGGARLLGIHLEGPFISSGKLGAQPDAARAGTVEEVGALHALAPVRVVTLAPELPGQLDFIRALRAAGIVPQLGHTAGSYEDGVAALEAGARGFTHLFNAMTGLAHRKPGVAAAALAHAQFAELIPDLLHVHPGAMRVALRAIPRLYCVTDATAGAGMPDGTYHLGAQRVTKCLGGVRLADGTLAGSTLTMDQALRNLVSLGVPLDEASRRTSTYAAEYLGLEDRGRIAAGCHADLVVLTPALRLAAVHVEGESIELADAG